jgi:hypothetical protein
MPFAADGRTRPRDPPDNCTIAARLEGVAALLAAQRVNASRIACYRDAAAAVRTLSRPVADIIATEGAAGLIALPGIGNSLARTIEQLATTGTTPLLDRLQGSSDPVGTLAAIPGLGRQLAARIHERLGVETLADLEAAAWDGRLKTVPWIGARRVQAIRDSLASKNGRPRPALDPPRYEDEPSVAELLSLDEEYRCKAADRLPCVAPYRFNPARAAWLPILHSTRADRHYTALYSHTPRVQSPGTTPDGVVIYRDDPGGHGHWTVITAGLGPLYGKRIVRGREDECTRLYAEDRR